MNPRQGIETLDWGEPSPQDGGGGSRKTVNPRQGIETLRPGMPQPHGGCRGRKTVNPRQGIETVRRTLTVNQQPVQQSEDSESSSGD